MDLATLLRGGTTGRGDPYLNEKSMFGTRRGPAPIPWNQLSSPGPAPIPWNQFSGSGPAGPGPIPWDMLSDGRPRPPHSLTPAPSLAASTVAAAAAAPNQPQPPHSRTPLTTLPDAGGDPNAPNWWTHGAGTSGGPSDTGMSGLMGLLRLLYGGTA